MPVSVALLGDVSLHGHWSDPVNEPFGAEIAAALRAHDVVMLNLESMVHGNGAENHLRVPRLATTVEAVRSLAAIRPTVCVLGNNHAFDHLEDGIRRTQEAVRAAGALAIGAGTAAGEAAAPLRFSAQGVEFSVLAYVGDESDPCLPPGKEYAVNRFELERAVEDVARERRLGRFVVVSLHWGREFGRHPAPAQRRAARRLAAAGAGVIWGHHAHVCQGWEHVDGCPVFYCLGNAVFDDLPAIPLTWNEEGRRSIMVTLDVEPGRMRPTAVAVRLVQRADARSVPVEIPVATLRSRRRLLALPGYAVFYRLYRGVAWLRRARDYFFAPGRSPVRQFAYLPSRLWRSRA